MGFHSNFFFLLYTEEFLPISSLLEPVFPKAPDPVVFPFSVDVLWQEGKASGAVYSREKELTELLEKVSECPVLEGSVWPCQFRLLHFFLLIFVIKKNYLMKVYC